MANEGDMGRTVTYNKGPNPFSSLKHNWRSQITRAINAQLGPSRFQVDQTQERMASDSDGFPKNPNAVEQARHKAAIEISTLRSLLSYQFNSKELCPVV